MTNQQQTNGVQTMTTTTTRRLGVELTLTIDETTSLGATLVATNGPEFVEVWGVHVASAPNQRGRSLRMNTVRNRVARAWGRLGADIGLDARDAHGAYSPLVDWVVANVTRRAERFFPCPCIPSRGMCAMCRRLF